MMGKTHIAAGIATAFVLMQPKNVSELAIATVGGSIGGVMADIDVKIDRSNKYAKNASMDALYGEILAIVISISVLLSDFLSGGYVIPSIANHWQMSVIGLALFFILTVIGEHSKHRDKTHSALAWTLFSISVVLIEPGIGLAFAIGYGSHLILDLFNKSPIRLFYPREGGICFKVCYANQLGNELFLAGGVFIMTLYIFQML